MPAIELHLPLPTSANKLWEPFINYVRGKPFADMRRTKAYESWLHDAGWLVKGQLAKATMRKVSGPYKISLQAVRPDKRHRDLLNYEKAVSDLLVSLAVIDDDSFCEMGSARWVTVGDGIYVRIEPAGVE